ncbi:MAG: response regulator [Desulfococcaceae bacterium]
MPEKVLLVGEEEDFLSHLIEQIRTRDMRVSRALSAKAGLEMAGREDFSIIILNLTVPGSDGIEMMKNFKQINSEQDVFLLSRHVTAKKGIHAMKLGAADLLDKSVNPRILAEKIAKSRAKKMLPVRKA